MSISQRCSLTRAALIIAASYFWSGLQKIGIGFTDRVFPSLINPYLNFVFGRINLLPRPLILMIPLLEIGIGHRPADSTIQKSRSACGADDAHPDTWLYLFRSNATV